MIPLQAWTDPEDSWRLRLPDFKTIDTWRWQGCQPYAPAVFTLQEIFLVLISVRDWVNHSAVGRIVSRKNSNDIIGNRTSDLPAGSAVPQPNVPLRAPHLQCCETKISKKSKTDPQQPKSIIAWYQDTIDLYHLVYMNTGWGDQCGILLPTPPPNFRKELELKKNLKKLKERTKFTQY